MTPSSNIRCNADDANDDECDDDDRCNAASLRCQNAPAASAAGGNSLGNLHHLFTNDADDVDERRDDDQCYASQTTHLNTSPGVTIPGGVTQGNTDEAKCVAYYHKLVNEGVDRRNSFGRPMAALERLRIPAMPATRFFLYTDPEDNAGLVSTMYDE